jgi:PAS domain S-box-containing protein
VETESITTTVLGNLFERTTTPMLLADDARRYRDANEAATTLLGRSREEIRILRVEHLVAPDRRDSVPALWRNFLADGSQSGTIGLLRADGTEVAVSYSATANVVPGLHLSVFLRPGREDPVLDREAERPRPSLRQRLSVRERQVLSMLALGATGPEVAGVLHLAPETVRTHTRTARRKLGARTRSHALALAIKSGQIDV